MYTALKAEARLRPNPMSVNRLIVELLLEKYRDLAKKMK